MLARCRRAHTGPVPDRPGVAPREHPAAAPRSWAGWPCLARPKGVCPPVASAPVCIYTPCALRPTRQSSLPPAAAPSFPPSMPAAPAPAPALAASPTSALSVSRPPSPLGLASPYERSCARADGHRRSSSASSCSVSSACNLATPGTASSSESSSQACHTAPSTPLSSHRRPLRSPSLQRVRKQQRDTPYRAGDAGLRVLVVDDNLVQLAGTCPPPPDYKRPDHH